MTRSRVIQLGILFFLLGGFGYGFFRLFGLNGISSGIASEALLVALVVVWIGSYLFRVITGNMTFMEQRKRYLKAYEELTTAELKARFDAMSEDEQMQLMQELDLENNKSSSFSDE